MNILEIVSNFGGIKDKAPEVLSGFLDKILEENLCHLKPEQGEVQMCYLMFPVTREDKREYYISIVTLDKNDTVKRMIKCIKLKDALTTIFNSAV